MLPLNRPAAALLGACATPPAAPGPGTTGVTVPASWSTGATTHAPPSTAGSLAEWWQRFNDPALGALVSQALQANTGVRSAQAALQQARAQRDVQQANSGPSLSASGSAQRSRSGTADASSRFQAGFDALKRQLGG